MVKFRHFILSICIITLLCSLFFCVTYSSLFASKTATGVIEIEMPQSQDLDVQIYCDNGVWSASKSTIIGSYSETIDKVGCYYLCFRYHKPLIYEVGESPIYNTGFTNFGTYVKKLIQVADFENSIYSTDKTGWDSYMGINMQKSHNVGETYNFNEAIQAFIDYLDGREAPTETYQSNEYCEDVVLCYTTSLQYSTSADLPGKIVKSYNSIRISFVGSSNKT